MTKKEKQQHKDNDNVQKNKTLVHKYLLCLWYIDFTI